MALIKKARSFERVVKGRCGQEDFEVKVKFRILGKSEQQKINELLMHSYKTAKANENSEDPAIMLELTDKDGDSLGNIDLKIAKKVVCGWDDYVDENGNPIEFNEENLEEFVDLDGVGEVLVQEYISGYADIKAKNSQTLRSGSADPPTQEDQTE